MEEIIKRHFVVKEFEFIALLKAKFPILAKYEDSKFYIYYSSGNGRLELEIKD